VSEYVVVHADQVQAVNSGMSHVAGVPLSIFIQYESSLVVGVIMRAQTLYVPVVGILSENVARPVVGIPVWLLFPAVTMMYVPPDAAASAPVVIGDVRVPLSASGQR
jgi:hypothetical protein